MHRIGLLVLALVAATPAALGAQTPAAERLQVSTPDPRLWGAVAMAAAGSTEPAAPRPQLRPSSTAKLAGVGLLAGAAAFVGGAYLGGWIENELFPCTCDDPGLRGALRGATALSQIVIPVSVHLVDDENASLARTFAGSLLGSALVAAGAAVAGGDDKLTIAFFGAPVGALVGSVIAASR